jgi:hypothetical protein
MKIVFTGILNSAAILNFYAWQHFLIFFQLIISKDGVNSDSLALGVRDCTHCAQDRQSWKDLLEQALTKYWL